MERAMSQSPPGRRAGKVLMMLAWIAGLFLATRFFGEWEDRQHNPNSEMLSEQGDGYVEVRLAGNRQGHFVGTAQLNGRPVAFMIDTGATDVAIPAEVVDELGLERGVPVTVNTANGRVQGFRTRVERLQLGQIVLHDVRALVTPSLEGREILLGMSAMKQLEFTQRSGTLLLRQTTQ
nr:TIGR02281 family clan AA aspartic protease [Pseudomonas sp. StFLB209]